MNPEELLQALQQTNALLQSFSTAQITRRLSERQVSSLVRLGGQIRAIAIENNAYLQDIMGYLREDPLSRFTPGPDGDPCRCCLGTGRE